MGKLTTDEFIKRANEKNDRMRSGKFEVRGEYVDARTPIVCHCNVHGIDWNANPDRIYYGVGCEECVLDVKRSKRTPHDEFIKNVTEKNEYVRNGNIIILGLYGGNNTPIQTKCVIHDYIWYPTPHNLCQGYGCKKCGYERSAAKTRMSHNEFMSIVSENNVHVKNGIVEIVGQFNGMDATIDCFCHIHQYHWSAKAIKIYIGQGCKYCGYESSAKKHTKSYEQVVKELQDLGTDIKIVGSYINEYTPVDCKCSLGHIWESKIINILQGVGCPYCSNERVLVGFNDAWTTHPQICKYLKNPTDGYKYTYGSTHKTDFICPDCGSIIHKSFNYVTFNGLLCCNCSDGVSYPNKFLRQMLQQLKIDFVPEYSAEWSQSKKYDCYFKINQQEYVVEMDGIQHYEESTLTPLSINEIVNNDKMKTLLAIQNGLDIIRIDCRKSDCEYIKQNILSSRLNIIFNLSAINWELCDYNAQKSLVKAACDLYMSGIHSPQEIGRILHVNRSTVRGYLKHGEKYGWCNYCIPSNKAIELLDHDMNVVKSFSDVNECDEYLRTVYNLKTSKSGIYGACRNNTTYKGLNIRYINHNNTKLIEGGIANGT